MTEFPRIDSKIIGLDYETTGLRYWDPDFRALGVGVSTADAEWYFDFRTVPRVGDWLRDLLPGRTCIAHNAQFEYQVTRTLGINPRRVDWLCTMVCECLIFEHHLTYNLEDVAGYYSIANKKSYWLDQMMLAMGLESHAAVLAALDRAPSDLLSQYGAGDARMCFDIAMAQRAEIERAELSRVVDLEMRLLPVLADMSWRGVRVNLEAAEAAIPKLDAREAEIATTIQEITGCKDPSVFVNSPKQMREFFKPEPVNRYQWRLIDGTLVGPTKGGKGPSLGQDALRQIQHPLAAQVLDLRKTIKLRDTFIRGHVIGSADGDGYVHTSFNQTRTDADAGTVTGRLSSTDPALQQITKRDKANAAILRAMFLPDPGQQWFCADYSQVDFRCGAHLQNDPDVIAAYWENPKMDYHQIVSDMTGIPRNPPYAGAPNTKQINLGLSFGAGAGKLAFMMGMPYELSEYRGRMAYLPGPEAKNIFDMYHARLPAVKRFMKHAENVAKARGFVRTLTGRRLRFFTTGGEHKAAGLLYQSYAADLHKVGLIGVDTLLRENSSESGPEPAARLLVSVHDEIGVSMHPDSELGRKIVERYTDFNGPDSWIKMRVPITASGEFGANWWEASK
jgi:DNA polymerase I-like protein with 3'-5' exonuclease and polymerase domains